MKVCDAVANAFVKEGVTTLFGLLADVGVRREPFATIAEQAMHDGWLHANPRKLTDVEQALEILEMAA